MYRLSPFLLFAAACSDYDLLAKELDELIGEDTGAPDVDPEDSIDTADTGEPDTDEPVDDPNRPVAVCDVSPNPVQPPFEAATWNGADSYDPSGQPLMSYSWALTQKPEGSSATFNNSSASVISNFVPDLAGDYVGRLTVTNQAGLTDSCETTLQSIPAQNLWVEMFWQYPDEDMDLHLIAPGANWQSAKTTDQDCYFANCTPNAWIPLDWGQPNSTADDPSLDIDDIPGTGPENINIYNPESNGAYTVVVHDYQGSTGDVQGPNEVTVNIYLNGVLAWSDTRAISGENTYTPFAKIDWGSGTVIPQ